MFLLVYLLFHITGAYPEFNRNLETYEVNNKIKIKIIGFEKLKDKNATGSYL